MVLERNKPRKSVSPWGEETYSKDHFDSAAAKTRTGNKQPAGKEPDGEGGTWGGWRGVGG